MPPGDEYLPFYHYRRLIAEREALAEDARIRARYDVEALEEAEEHEEEIKRLEAALKAWRAEHPDDRHEPRRRGQGRQVGRILRPRAHNF